MEQYTQNSKGTKAEADRCMAAFLLIKEDKIRLQLDRERESLRFTPVEITPEELSPEPGL